MKHIKFLLIFSLLVTTMACKKNKIGGKATVKGVVAHHEKPIPNAIVYIKYNATEFPGDNTALYDSYVNADNAGNYSISLYKGTYYLYAVGKDADIPLPNDVKGGLSFSIRFNQDLEKNIAVAE